MRFMWSDASPKSCTTIQRHFYLVVWQGALLLQIERNEFWRLLFALKRMDPNHMAISGNAGGIFVEGSGCR